MPSEPVTTEITQADRDAAAPWVIVPANSRKIKDGEMDWNPLVEAFARHRLAPILPSGDADELRAKLRMIVSHATDGSSQDIDAPVNDICVRISATRNAVYQASYELGREDAAKVADAEQCPDMRNASWARILSNFTCRKIAEKIRDLQKDPAR